MGTRTVRLDDETEETLDQIRQATGLSISEVLKQGVRAIRGVLSRRAGPTPFEIYQQLDLGEGGYAGAPSTEVRRGVKEALGTRKVFTLDRKDFESYRVKRGHRHYGFIIISHQT